MSNTKSKAGRPTKLTAKLIDRVVAAISKGCTYSQAARSCGIIEQTFYKWLRLGRNGQGGNYKKLADAVANAENDRLVTLLEVVTSHAAKDWRAGAFLLERRYGYTKENNNHEIPRAEETIEIPSTLEGILKKQITDISTAMAKANQNNSFQAYAALQRQLITVVTQLKSIQDDSGEYNEMDEMTDEQILTMIEQSFLNLPPVLRQRAIDRLTR